MRITGIEPFVIGTFHRNARRHWLIFKLLTDEGIYGLGEASLHEYDDQMIAILEQWVERYLAGKDPMHHELHWTRLYQDTWLKKIAAIAEAQHVTLAPHNTNSPVGTVASFHVAASTPNFLIQEYHAEFYEPWFFDLCPGQPRRSGAYVPLPTGPGLGITLDETGARAHPLQPRTGWRTRGI